MFFINYGHSCSDAATGVDTAHNSTECSDRGLCDRATDQCVYGRATDQCVCESGRIEGR